ncbi:reverse transcriptase domain-containing protein [Cobetia marina]|uniref:reverse transcriptase domain-containing protein n=1 Tax=Cobetia marina TaxID=28258 RepID=UPI00384E6F96
MFEDIVTRENFYDAYRKTQKGKSKFKVDAIVFASNESINIEALRQELLSGIYSPSSYVEFSVFEPKERVIYAPRYRDKIVQHAINNVLRDFYEPKFIFDSYACIRGKGNLRAVSRARNFMQSASRIYSDPWIVKADVQKFFYSIDRRVLKEIVKRKLGCQKTTDLLFLIMDSTPTEKGLPLGNLTSQLMANVLMNEIDQYIKRRLGVRFYIRYADDLMMIVDGKAQASDILGCIRSFGRDVIHLTFPDRKCFIRPLRSKQGLEFLGYRITPSRIGLTSSSRSRIIRRLAIYDRKISDGSIPKDKVIESLVSWYSYASVARCEKFVKEACSRTRNIRFSESKFIVRSL